MCIPRNKFLSFAASNLFLGTIEKFYPSFTILCTMAEIFGAVAAGIAIGGELIRFGREIQRSIERIKNSRQDVENLASETIIFAGLYQRFLRACKKDRRARTTDAPAVLPLIRWAEATLAKLDRLLSKVQGLHSEHKPRTRWEDTTIARVIWLKSTRKVKVLRSSLSVARESVIGFTNLMYLDELRDQLKRLKKALDSPNERRELETRLGIALTKKIDEVETEMCFFDPSQNGSR